MKFKRIIKLLILSLSYFWVVLYLFVFWAMYPYMDFWSELPFNIITLPFLFFPLYVIFYDRQWAVKPAKIIFWLLTPYLLFSVYDYFSIDTFSLASLCLVVLSLLHVYRDKIKVWFQSLKIKPFYSMKKRSEISLHAGYPFL